MVDAINVNLFDFTWTIQILSQINTLCPPGAHHINTDTYKSLESFYYIS